jgi:hypothetical protein
MRITIQRDPKMTGTPLNIYLGKCSEGEAIRQRDNHLRVLSRVGVEVNLRKSRKKSA